MIAILANLLNVKSHKLISQIRFCRRSSMSIPINYVYLFYTYTWNIYLYKYRATKDLFALPILFSRTFSPSLAKLLIPSFSNYTDSPIPSSTSPYSYALSLSLSLDPPPSLSLSLSLSFSLSSLFVSENIQFER